MTKRHFLTSLFLTPLAAVVGKKLPHGGFLCNPMIPPAVRPEVFLRGDIQWVEFASFYALEDLKRDIEARWCK